MITLLCFYLYTYKRYLWHHFIIKNKEDNALPLIIEFSVLPYIIIYNHNKSFYASRVPHLHIRQDCPFWSSRHTGDFQRVFLIGTHGHFHLFKNCKARGPPDWFPAALLRNNNPNISKPH